MQIANELNKLGVKSSYQHDIWSASSVRVMLLNTTYAGFFYYNKYKRQGKKLILRDKSEWIKIECTPLISNEIFEAAQDILKYNREYKRKLPKRFYLLSGMIICADCQKAYVAQTIRAGTQRRKTDAQGYRHNMFQGHCSNKWITAKVLETLVWDKVVSILLDPMSLQEGYERAIEHEQQKQARHIQHIETLQTAIEKLKAKRVRLQKTYLDPDIGMTKAEYLEEKQTIEDQINNASLDLEKLAGELQRIPTESDLENLEKMASIILNALGNNLDISPPDKRHVMQMLNLKVRISRNGSIKLEGWFAPESDGLLSITSPHFLKQTLLPP